MTTISSSVPTSAQSIVEEPWKPLFWAEVGALIQTLRSETSLQKTVRYKGKDKYGEGGGHWLDMRARSTAGKLAAKRWLQTGLLVLFFLFEPRASFMK